MLSLVLVFVKMESENKTKYDTFYSNWKAETIINESYIDDVFESIHSTMIWNIQKSLEKGSVTGHKISISKYNPLKLPK